MVGAKSQKAWVYNDIEIEQVMNVTPKELNTPDFEGGRLQGLIAVFVFKVNIIQTVAAQGGTMYEFQRFYQNATALTGAQVANPLAGHTSEMQSKTKERIYVVSVPSHPFSRMAMNNPMYNPISMQVYKASGLDVQTPKIQNMEYKMIFPSDKPYMKKISATQLKALVDGELPGKDSSDDEDE